MPISGAFSSEEKVFIDSLEEALYGMGSPFCDLMEQRRSDLDQLAGIVRRAPSLMKDLDLSRQERNGESLSRVLYNKGVLEINRQPTKAVIGYSFTVSRLHFFGLIRKICYKFRDELGNFREQAENLYGKELFSIMAEELYRCVLNRSSLDAPWSARVSRALVNLWEYRLSDKDISFAPFVQSLWNVRKQLVPVLGTLMGSYELLCLSFQLSAVWSDFLSRRIEDQKRNQALEEFLFDLSFEELGSLRIIMKEERLNAISREDADRLLGRKLNERLDELPANQLYESFLLRSRNSQIRYYRQSAGPWKTIEEYFVEYYYTLETEPAFA